MDDRCGDPHDGSDGFGDELELAGPRLPEGVVGLERLEALDDETLLGFDHDVAAGLEQRPQAREEVHEAAEVERAVCADRLDEAAVGAERVRHEGTAALRGEPRPACRFRDRVRMGGRARRRHRPQEWGARFKPHHVRGGVVAAASVPRRRCVGRAILAFDAHI